jgi:ribosomal protein S15P/S13E
MPVKFTVLLCVHRPPGMLPFSIQTVLAQHHTDLELFVVGDGAPAETIDCANAFAAKDPRVRVFDFPKGERHGEAHRHAVLAEASGEFVAHIADDDLWFPDHLKELGALLEQVEFGNLTMTTALPDGTFGFHPGDLADRKTQERMLSERWNFFAPTVAGYRLSTYRRMPVGWSPAPPDLWSDLHMWRKFLRLDGISVGTRFVIESIAIPGVHRPAAPMQEREAENERWFQIVSDAQSRCTLRAQIAEALARHHAASVQELLVREKELQDLYQRVNEKDAALAQQAAEAGQRLLSRQEEIDDLHRGIDGLNADVAERAGSVERLDGLLKEKDAALAQQAAEAAQQLLSREEQIDNLYHRIAALDAYLSDRAELIERLDGRVKEKDAHLAGHAAVAAENLRSRDNEIEMLYRHIAELNRHIADLNAHLSERAELIERLANRVSEKDAELARRAAVTSGRIDPPA